MRVAGGDFTPKPVVLQDSQTPHFMSVLPCIQAFREGLERFHAQTTNLRGGTERREPFFPMAVLEFLRMTKYRFTQLIFIGFNISVELDGYLF